MTCGILFAVGTTALALAIIILYKRTGADDVVDAMNDATRGDL